MSFVNFQVELSRSNDLLERIAVALERLAGPVPIPRSPVKSGLSDLHLSSPREVQKAKDAAAETARMSGFVPESEAARRFLDELEAEFRRQYGDDVALPWRVKTFEELERGE